MTETAETAQCFVTVGGVRIAISQSVECDDTPEEIASNAAEQVWLAMEVNHQGDLDREHPLYSSVNRMTGDTYMNEVFEVEMPDKTVIPMMPLSIGWERADVELEPIFDDGRIIGFG